MILAEITTSDNKMGGANPHIQAYGGLLGRFVAEESMPGRRPDSRGSFGGQLHELVKHFPHKVGAPDHSDAIDGAQQEKRDIHAMLFDRAWQLDGNDGR